MKLPPTTQALTRRRFLQGCAAAGAVAACAGPVTALANPAPGAGDIGPDARPTYETAPSVCQACPNGCAFTAYVVNGKLNKTLGNGLDSQAAGTLCARGYGYTFSADEKGIVRNPLMRKENGDFKTVSWDEALQFVAARLEEIISKDGPQALGLIFNGASTTAAAYAPRFMRALGSGNVFVNDVTTNVAKQAAFTQVIGVPDYTPDFEQANLILLIDTSYADIACPGTVSALQAARQKQTPMVAIDARLGTVASMADTWLPVNPGTELALLLALCNQLIQMGRYDEAFVAANTSGFSQWAEAISQCTPAWAAEVCGVQQVRIEDLASKLASAAPNVAIQYGNGTIGQASFSNTTETARTVCLLNTLLGTWRNPGGALLPFDFANVQLDAVMGAAAAGKGMVGLTQLAFAASRTLFPLGVEFGASAATALRNVGASAIKALIAVDTNIAYDYAAIPDLTDKLEDTPLFVCIAHEMNETALAADVVLPLASYLEAADLPLFTSGKTATVAVSTVVTQPETNALPLADIFQKMAQALGKAAIPFTLEEATAAELEAVGLSVEGMQAEGVAQLTQGQVQRITDWRTPTGKIQCASAACAAAGISATPVWVPTFATSNIQALYEEDMNFGVHNKVDMFTESGRNSQPKFHLITGVQTVIGNTGANTPQLMDVADMYQLDSVWINADVAAIMGIQTGDEVVVGNKQASAPMTAFVTQRIVPTAVYVPAGFGHTSKKQPVANGVGVNPAIFTTPVIDNGYGTLCTQEASVWVWKEGA